MFYVNQYHLGGVSIADSPCDTSICESCGDSNWAMSFKTLEDACFYVLTEYGEDVLNECGYKIAKFEVKEVE